MPRARLWLVGVVCVEVWACSRGSTGPSAGTVSGSVTSSLGGGIGGATVVVTPTGGSALPAVQTTAGGTYSVPSVPDGAGTVVIEGDTVVPSLPANCTAPSPASYSGVTGGRTVTVNVIVPCTPPVLTVRGVVTSSLGGAIAGATVVVTPAGGSAVPAVQTTAGGIYSVPSVPDGSGSVALSSLPPNCTAPGPASYAGVAGGGTVTVNVTVPCAPPDGPFGTVTGRVTSSRGGVSGAVVVVTPAGDSAFQPVVTDASGSYTVSAVPVGGNAGSGSVAVSRGGGRGIAGCGPGGAVYSGLAGGETVTVDIQVRCTPTPINVGPDFGDGSI